MSLINTGLPNYIQYTDPIFNPANLNYNYPAEHQQTVLDISNRLPINFLFKTASSGTISTTELQILSGYTFPFAYSGPQPTSGMSVYAHIDISAIASSVETTGINFSGYIRAEAYISGVPTAYSASEKAWFFTGVQSTLRLKMSTKINPGSDMTLKFFSESRSATKRFKLFETRLLPVEQLPVNVTLTFSHQNTL